MYKIAMFHRGAVVGKERRHRQHKKREFGLISILGLLINGWSNLSIPEPVFVLPEHGLEEERLS